MTPVLLLQFRSQPLQCGAELLIGLDPGAASWWPVSQVPKTDLKVEWVENLAPVLHSYAMAIARGQKKSRRQINAISECVDTGIDVS